jgi:malate synthase
VSRLAGRTDERGKTLLAAARDVFEKTCLVEDWPQFFTSYAYDSYLVAR